MNHTAIKRPATLLLADGTVFSGEAIGADKTAIGEICFNTAMTGYQEILTDPSYAGQLITFTFPHIGNTGCNAEDFESKAPLCAGLIIREKPTEPSNFRCESSLNSWLEKHDITGICGVDTRALTRHIRTHGAQNGMILIGADATDATFIAETLSELKAFPSMKGLELAADVTTKKTFEWDKPLWRLRPSSNPKLSSPNPHVVAVDYGVKHNILRNLVDAGCRVTVVPAKTSAAEIFALNPDGIFLSNGPGDPSATGLYAIPVIKELIDSSLPIFGICLGHQLLALALGGKTEKMPQGHRGANHPIQNVKTGEVMITSQNHGFCVSKDGLPADIELTHISLFDGTVQGLRHKTKPIFCLQGHPEASPGPHDTQVFFAQFTQMIDSYRKKQNVA
jgi:carbamoyl-phosphate synthase small subunit